MKQNELEMLNKKLKSKYPYLKVYFDSKRRQLYLAFDGTVEAKMTHLKCFCTAYVSPSVSITKEDSEPMCPYMLMDAIPMFLTAIQSFPKYVDDFSAYSDDYKAAIAAATSKPDVEMHTRFLNTNEKAIELMNAITIQVNSMPSPVQ